MRRLLALLLLAAVPACAQSWVQSTKADFATGTTVSASSINVTAGHLLVVGSQANAQDEKDTVTDSQGNAYTSVIVTLGAVQECRISYAIAKTTGADVISVNNTASVTMGIAASEFVLVNGTPDQKAGQSATSSTSPSITTTVANEVLIAFLSSNATAGLSIAAPFNQRESLLSAGSIFGGYADEIVSSTGTYHFSIGTSASTVTIIASFYSGAAPGGTAGSLTLTGTGTN